MNVQPRWPGSAVLVNPAFLAFTLAFYLRLALQLFVLRFSRQGADQGETILNYPELTIAQQMIFEGI